jgi:hypothetical protein
MDCFVYQVVQDVEVRCAPSIDVEAYRTSRWFKKGELVSIDLIKDDFLDGDTPESGPFLRLSDGSGWVFEKKKGQGVMMKPKTVEKGLWVFYIANFPVGIALRNHPIDQSESNPLIQQVPRVVLTPMQVVYCDRRVAGSAGVNFYRIQQGPNCCPAWVFDKRGTAPFLIPGAQVEKGLFAFQVVSGGIAIRLRPSVEENCKTNRVVHAGDGLIACDIIYDRHPEEGNGPYLRLTDASGWLFCNKENEALMEAVPIVDGHFVLRVVNSNGIRLRKQPIDDTKSIFKKAFAQNEVVNCSKKIGPSSSGITFYQVEGTNGWVFDKHGDHVMMELVSSPDNSTSMVGKLSAALSDAWTVDFVRGVAFAKAYGIKEISHNIESRVISFRHPNGARINVYYSTKTVGTALDHPQQGKTQLFRRNCTKEELAEIFDNPRLHTGRGYQRTSKRHRSSNGPENVVSSLHHNNDHGETSLSSDDHVNAQEEDLRSCLVDAEEATNDCKIKLDAIWRSVAARQDNRFQDEAKAYIQGIRHAVELQLEAAEQEEARRRAEALAQEEARRRAEALALTCCVCARSFVNFHALNQHKNAVSHW